MSEWKDTEIPGIQVSYARSEDILHENIVPILGKYNLTDMDKALLNTEIYRLIKDNAWDELQILWEKP